MGGYEIWRRAELPGGKWRLWSLESGVRKPIAPSVVPFLVVPFLGWTFRPDRGKITARWSLRHWPPRPFFFLLHATAARDADSLKAY